MWKFIKSILSTFIALILFFVFVIFLFVGIAASMSSGKEVVTIKENSVLSLDLNQKILEKEIENPFEGLDIPFAPDNGGIGMIELCKTIRAAKEDAKISGIYLNFDAIPAGFATIEEIRNALIDFKSSGKFVYAYSETYSEGAYYLVSVSDKIFLNPAGLLELNGLSSKSIFFKGLLEKLEIKPQVFKVGDYKSAVEPFLLDKMSDYNKEQTLSFMNSIYNFILGNIAQSRGLTFKEVKLISDSMLIHNPKDALKYKIITNIAYYDEVLEELKATIGIKSDSKINFVSYKKYKSSLKEEETKSENKIAVIVAQGDIVSGKSEDESIGSDDMAAEIRKARLDTNVKAVVLRINSPGGSAMASDVMWREVVLTKAQKPIIASMGDVAASGGYYLAMGATKIVAQENSITGSIGVFGIIFNIKNFLKNKLGITTDGVKTGLFSDIESLTKDLSDYEKKSIQQEVDNIYEDFTSKAAEGRKMSVAELKKVASGRVWSGLEAKRINLVDSLGGINTAISMAISEAKLDSSNYKVVYYPESKDVLTKFIENFQNDTKDSKLRAELGPYYNTYKSAIQLKRLEGIQARFLGETDF